jgi:poly(3-hydroxybutyrate) depolymerase
MQGLVLALAVVVVAAGAWVHAHQGGRGYESTHGSTVTRFTLQSSILGRGLDEVLVRPPSGGRGRTLLVFLHGRGAKPDFILGDRFFEALRGLGRRAPDVLLADGGDHSYWHDRRDGRWGNVRARDPRDRTATSPHAETLASRSCSLLARFGRIGRRLRFLGTAGVFVGAPRC